MAQTTWKCQWCGISDTHKDEMEVEYKGERKTPKRYHKHCYQKYLKDEEFKAGEQVEKDALFEVLKRIYGVSEVPSQAWTMLANLREGNPVSGNRKDLTKRQKEGYDYSLIRETFDYCSDTIEYYNARKGFDGFMSAFRYAMSIIIDKIYVVEQRRTDRERQQALIEKHVEVAETPKEEFVSSFKKKKKSNTDISDFLD